MPKIVDTPCTKRQQNHTRLFVTANQRAVARSARYSTSVLTNPTQQTKRIRPRDSNSICFCKICTFVFGIVVLGRPRVYSRAFGCGASKGSVGTLRRISESRPSSVARALRFQSRRAGSYVQGLRSALLSRVGPFRPFKTPQLVDIFK